MRIETDAIAKEIVIKNNKIIGCTLTNKITNKSLILQNYKEFELSYIVSKNLLKTEKNLISSNDFLVEEKGNKLQFAGRIGEKDCNFDVIYEVDTKSDTIKKHIEFSINNDIEIDYLTLDSFVVPDVYTFTIPEVKDRVYVPNRIFILGQPYYVGDMFFGGEFPVSENRIIDNIASSKYYFGRKFCEISSNGVYKSIDFVTGAGTGDNFNEMRASFFKYISTIAQKERFRVQYNSWYDYMLDITSDKIKDSFTEVSKNLTKQGFRPLDCYVVDDGWTDYKKKEFWEFNLQHFPNKFDNEKQLTEQLNSTFGVWFGPRGGYTTETIKYAKRLKSIGYNVCKQSFDICTGDPKYIKDLTDKMAEFCEKYNVTYYKIDGFATTPCKSSKHGHPVGKGDGIYFYTFLWEEWIKGFEKIRKVQKDVFLNITSYAHPSPYFLKYVNAMWLNNCGDMGYEGDGDNLSQCLNYRDGKYRDFYEIRKLQFPCGYIYNHEPCYANRNYNPPLPSKKHKTVEYTYEQFREYLYMCMMRGTGFVELYFSPNMFDDTRWKITVEVLNWAEQHFDIIKHSQFFGGVPKDKTQYGYYAKNKKDAIMIVRNSDDKDAEYVLDNAKLSFDNSTYSICEYYPVASEKVKVLDNNYTILLKPYEIKIFYITID